MYTGRYSHQWRGYGRAIAPALPTQPKSISRGLGRGSGLLLQGNLQLAKQGSITLAKMEWISNWFFFLWHRTTLGMHHCTKAVERQNPAIIVEANTIIVFDMEQFDWLKISRVRQARILFSTLITTNLQQNYRKRNRRVRNTFWRSIRQ